MEMVAVHDLVEIDAGDVSAYDVGAFAAKAVRETSGGGEDFWRCFQPINTSSSDNYGTSSRRMRRRKRDSPTPSIDCSR